MGNLPQGEGSDLEVAFPYIAYKFFLGWINTLTWTIFKYYTQKFISISLTPNICFWFLVPNFRRGSWEVGIICHTFILFFHLHERQSQEGSCVTLICRWSPIQLITNLLLLNFIQQWYQHFTTQLLWKDKNQMETWMSFLPYPYHKCHKRKREVYFKNDVVIKPNFTFYNIL